MTQKLKKAHEKILISEISWKPQKNLVPSFMTLTQSNRCWYLWHILKGFENTILKIIFYWFIQILNLIDLNKNTLLVFFSSQIFVFITQSAVKLFLTLLMISGFARKFCILVFSVLRNHKFSANSMLKAQPF